MGKHRERIYSEESYYPSFLFREVIVMVLTFVLVVILAFFFPAGLEDPADPTDNLYVPKPEWYFLFLYQLLKYFPGKLEIIASCVIPFAALVALLALPFIDTQPAKRLAQRPIAMLLMGTSVLAIILLTFLGMTS